MMGRVGTGLGVMGRGLAGIGLTVAVLAMLSLYRQTLGFPIFYLVLLTSILFWVAQATSWNVLSGFSGYFSFGQAAYLGVGAYTTAVLYGRHGVNVALTVVVAAGLCAVLALVVGALAFRLRSLRGEIFALLTLAVPFILAAVARINDVIDGGQGIIVAVPAYPEQIGLFQDLLYLLMLGVAGLAVAAAFAIQHSRFGRALAAIHDAEDVGEALGVATFRYKMQAIVVSAVIGGVAGSVFALQIGFVTVESVFSLTVPLFVIVMSVLGGRAHWLGPVIGAVLIVMLQDRLTTAQLAEWRLIVLGAILVLLVVIAPAGLYGRLRARPRATAVAFAVTVAVLAVVRLWGALLDWLVLGMLVAAVVAVWPMRSRAVEPKVATITPEEPAPGPASPGLTSDATEERARREGEASQAPGPARAERAQEIIVDCQGVARYFGGVRALEHVDLQIREGELVGLVGPNGSGKTTLVSLLSGTLRPTRGVIRIAGRDITILPPHRVAHVGVARTYQIPRPFGSMTVRDNVAIAIMFGRAARRLAAAREAAEEHLDSVGLSHLADAHPSELNLHQRQLLEIARAIATSPQVLLLDEALAGLNPVEIDAAAGVVRRIHSAGISIVIVEHVLRVVNQLATRVVVLDRGTVLADGEPAAVMSDPAVVRAYLGKRTHA
jgi:branched-chain amino acid transport system permease protein